MGMVTMRELNRNPSGVLERIKMGERLIVRSHRRPVATLQPLNGCVVQPFAEGEYDIEGSPLGDASEEARKLSGVEQDLLVRGQRGHRFFPSNISGAWQSSELREALDALGLRGLIHKGDLGWRLTGRGWLLREALIGQETFDPQIEWKGSKSTYHQIRRAGAWRLEEK